MNTEISIRPGTPEDVDAILGFIRALAEYEKLEHLVAATEEKLRETLFGERAFAETLIASIGGTAAGYSLFFHNYSTFLAKPGMYVEDVFVLPEYRRHGIGRALFKALAATALERGCGRLEWSVLDWNAPAIDFYQKLGAEVMPDWRMTRMTQPAMLELTRQS